MDCDRQINGQRLWKFRKRLFRDKPHLEYKTEAKLKRFYIKSYDDPQVLKSRSSIPKF